MTLAKTESDGGVGSGKEASAGAARIKFVLADTDCAFGCRPLR